MVNDYSMEHSEEPRSYLGGGLIQLVAYGEQDMYLTRQPQITFFKSVYRRNSEIKEVNGVKEVKGVKMKVIIKRKYINLSEFVRSNVADLSFNRDIENIIDADNFKCGICLQLFSDPTTLSCNHTFCRSCINNWKNKNNTCPLCRKYITDYKSDKKIQNQIYDLVINECTNCYRSHKIIDTCRRKCKICNFEFNQLTKPYQFKYHFLYKCKIKLIKECNTCFKIFKTNIINEHSSECKFKLSFHKVIKFDYTDDIKYIYNDNIKFVSLYVLKKNYELSKCLLINFPLVGVKEDSKIILNGKDRFTKNSGSYFNHIQPYSIHSNIPNDEVSTYSFALRPECTQPSGSCNMTKIDQSELNMYMYAVNYNVLRVMSGMSV